MMTVRRWGDVGIVTTGVVSQLLLTECDMHGLSLLVQCHSEVMTWAVTSIVVHSYNKNSTEMAQMHWPYYISDEY